MLTDRQFSVFESFTKAFACLFDGRIILRILLPFIIAGIICLILLFATWGPGIELFESLLQSLGWLSVALLKLQEWMGMALVGFLAGLIFLFLVFIFFYFVILILTSLILVPLLLPVIEEKYYHHLKKSPLQKSVNKMIFMASIINTIKFSFIYLFWLLVSLPFFLLPGAQLLISFFLNSYLVKSLFPMDVFMDYVSREEFLQIKEKYNSEFWQLSFLNNSLLYIPILNLIAPVVMALSFSIYCLGLVSHLRK
ncbi:MAG: EI24 domain-containing protein [Deltaproteobacteria bacterium]|nr:EI24 domain-containing protein [Deltaproteobacteria bacterium]